MTATTSDSKTTRIAIVGAGLAGRLVAQQVMKQTKANIDVFEKGSLTQPDSPAWISAAMLAPWAELEKAEGSVFELGKRSLVLWPEILKELEQEPELKQPVFFQNTGTLIVAFAQDQGRFKQYLRQCSAKSQQVLSSVCTLSQAMELEPILRQTQGLANQSLYFADEGQLCNREFFKASNQWLKNNVRVFDHQQVEPESLQNDYHWVFDCRGLGARSSWSQLRGVRGEVIRVRTQRPLLTRPVRLMHPRFPLYLAPKPNNELVIGATEIESESSCEVTVRSGLELLSALYALIPEMSEAEILEIKSGLRPTLFDHQPKFEIDKNLVRINGLYRHGWLCGPALVEQCLESLSLSHQNASVVPV